MKVPGVISKAKLPVMLMLMLVVPFMVDSWVSVGVKSFFYSLSLSIKTLLVFVLPFIVFSFVVACLARMGRNALFFTVLLIATVFISNITAIFTGYAIGYFMVPLVSVPVTEVAASSSLQALWHLDLVPVFTNKHALMAGFVAGILVTVIPYEPLRSLSVKASEGASWFLKHIFIPLLPFFILGFAFKLHEDGILRQAISAYGPILMLVIASQLCYLTLFYLVAARFSFSRFLEYVNNVVPAALTGLSTISSAASMPVLIEGTEKNIRNPLMARTIVPATINIHTIGSAIGLTILSLVTLNTFNLPIPELSFFALFAFYYALAKFSVAAVPGGVILVVGPILQSLLGFSDEMLGLITAVYLIFDPFGTAVNVSGNGAFAIVLSRMCEGLNNNDNPGDSISSADADSTS